MTEFTLARQRPGAFRLALPLRIAAARGFNSASSSRVPRRATSAAPVDSLVNPKSRSPALSACRCNSTLASETERAYCRPCVAGGICELDGRETSGGSECVELGANGGVVAVLLATGEGASGPSLGDRTDDVGVTTLVLIELLPVRRRVLSYTAYPPLAA